MKSRIRNDGCGSYRNQWQDVNYAVDRKSNVNAETDCAVIGTLGNGIWSQGN
jgi:hypothetical protein